MNLATGLSAAVMLAASLTSMAQAGVAEGQAEAAATPLVVTVSGFRAVSGNLFVGLYADEAGWDGGTSIRSTQAVIDNGVVTVQFDDLEPGHYGLKIYQDLNGNNELDSSAMGIPTEPYGFSNNARGTFGPASWSAASFTLSAGENSQTVTLR